MGIKQRDAQNLGGGTTSEFLCCRATYCQGSSLLQYTRQRRRVLLSAYSLPIVDECGKRYDGCQQVEHTRDNALGDHEEPPESPRVVHLADPRFPTEEAAALAGLKFAEEGESRSPDEYVDERGRERHQAQQQEERGRAAVGRGGGHRDADLPHYPWQARLALAGVMSEWGRQRRAHQGTVRRSGLRNFESIEPTLC